MSDLTEELRTIAAALGDMGQTENIWGEKVSLAADRLDEFGAGLNKIIALVDDPYLHTEDDAHGWYLGADAAQTIAREALDE